MWHSLQVRLPPLNKVLNILRYVLFNVFDIYSKEKASFGVHRVSLEMHLLSRKTIILKSTKWSETKHKLEKQFSKYDSIRSFTRSFIRCDCVQLKITM